MMSSIHFFARLIEEVCQSVRGSKAQHTWRLVVNLFISRQLIAGMFILEEDFSKFIFFSQKTMQGLVLLIQPWLWLEFLT